MRHRPPFRRPPANLLRLAALLYQPTDWHRPMQPVPIAGRVAGIAAAVAPLLDLADRAPIEMEPEVK